MQTIVEPKQSIAKLWGKQRILKDESYRLMKYVLRVDHEGGVLLHNVVTGQLVALDQEETEAIEALPSPFSPVLKSLVSEHYLVPLNYDERQQVINLRSILWRLFDTCASKDVVYYTILPTTSCNAHCWYCYEKGLNGVTMSSETANDVIDFISTHCGGRKVRIRWFGGEPTIAQDPINRICQGLRINDVEFTSKLTTNGYLLDENIIVNAKELWNLTHVTISIDGTESTTNRVKAFSSVSNNPYQTIMRNVGLLLKHEIYVGLRMNFSEDTFIEFSDLLKETKQRFGENPRLMIYARHINSDSDKHNLPAFEKWINKTIVDLNDLSRTNGTFVKEERLPSLLYRMCEAASDDAIVITPSGNLVSCAEQLGADQIKGDLKHGITNNSLAESWKKFADYKKCYDCVLLPECSRVIRCKGEDRCYTKMERINQYSEAIKHSFSVSLMQGA